MKFSEVSVFVHIAFFAILVMFVLDLVGFVSPDWQSYPNVNSGLWQRCVLGICDSYSSSNLTSAFQTVQAFEVLGFIAALVTLVVIICYLFVPPCADKDVLSIVTMALCFVICGLLLLGVIIYGAEAPTGVKYGYSFIMIILAAVLAFGAGILFVVDKVRAK